MEMQNQSRTANVITLIAGIWLILAPSLLSYSLNSARNNDLWLGIIVGVLSIARLIWPLRNAWISWVNVIAGIWLIIAPFILGYAGRGSMWNDVVLGIVIAAFAIWSSGMATTSAQAGQHHAHA